MSQLFYNYFVMCWQNGTVTLNQLQNALSRGFITQEEYDKIVVTEGPLNPDGGEL